MKAVPSGGITRRNATRWIAGSVLSGLALPSLLEGSAEAAPRTRPLDPDTSSFLDEMERQACLYFYEQADPATGQILDRANNR
ncbi:MAG TPA: hypothetical protein VGG95_12000, partial [Edaphobacter sp.]